MSHGAFKLNNPISWFLLEFSEWPFTPLCHPLFPLVPRTPVPLGIHPYTDEFLVGAHLHLMWIHPYTDGPYTEDHVCYTQAYSPIHLMYYYSYILFRTLIRSLVLSRYSSVALAYHPYTDYHNPSLGIRSCHQYPVLLDSIPILGIVLGWWGVMRLLHTTYAKLCVYSLSQCASVCTWTERDAPKLLGLVSLKHKNRTRVGSVILHPCGHFSKVTVWRRMPICETVAHAQPMRETAGECRCVPWW